MSDTKVNSETAATYSVSQVKLDSENEVIANAIKILESRLKKPDSYITSPKDAQALVRLELSQEKAEVFACMWLDNRHGVLAFDRLFNGTIDGASVHAREVVRKALEHNAAAVVLVHNHPSGVSDPSEADRKITARLKDALGLIDVRVLDHLVVGHDVTSFAEQGLI